jgi:hypothetical protein
MRAHLSIKEAPRLRSAPSGLATGPLKVFAGLKRGPKKLKFESVSEIQIETAETIDRTPT